MLHLRNKSVIFGLIVIVTGCQVGPKYEPPQITVSDQWKNEIQTTVIASKTTNWWDVFQDPYLACLIQQAIENNPNLKGSLERIEQARDLAKATKSRLFPQLTFDPSYSTSPITAHKFGTTSTPPPSLIRDHLTEYALPLLLLYEVDLWGKFKNTYKSALMNAEAAEEAHKTTLLILTTDLTNTYFQLRIQDAQIDLLQSILSTRKKNLEINTSRYEGNFINYTDVVTSKVAFNQVESEYYDAARKRAIFENQIAILLGVSPSEFKLDSMPLTNLPPIIPAGTPAKMLLRRPDLSEQERLMASLHAQINVAYASYFPSLDIIGGIKLLSKDFLKASKFGQWMFGTNLTQVIFDANSRYYNVKLTWAQFNEALDIYQQKTLNAFREVEDALSNLEWISKEINSTENSIGASKIAYNISLDRYKYGLSDYRNVADQELLELEQKQLYLSFLSMSYLNTVHLIKAIGGGWE